MDNTFGTSQTPNLSPNPGETSHPVSWLTDVSKAAQHLTRLTLESSAQAALITRESRLWAYAGQLPQSAAQELAETLARYWDRQDANDLVRFIRLSSTNAEHMLYATRLEEEMVLALIFDAETPFSTIRTQASQLVHSLADLPASNPCEDEPADEDDAPAIAISDILTDIPSPNPIIDSGRIVFHPDEATETEAPLPASSSPLFSRETSPATPLNSMHENGLGDEPLPDLEQTIESAAITRKSRPRREDLSETRPHSISEMGRQIVLEPVTPSVYNLDYACLLVPRLPAHHLTGDLSDKLSDWVKDICIAFGWRLEYISVRPEYLLWIANVAPATSPGYLMRTMRQHTSDKIFTDFVRFKKENPSGDFWAPGYLIMGGSQPPPAQLIKEFIYQTRQRQGISQPYR